MAPHHPGLGAEVSRDLASSIQEWPGHRGGSGSHPLSLDGPHPPSDGGQATGAGDGPSPEFGPSMLAAFVEVMEQER